jgi:hypothetical protein
MFLSIVCESESVASTDGNRTGRSQFNEGSDVEPDSESDRDHCAVKNDQKSG